MTRVIVSPIIPPGTGKIKIKSRSINPCLSLRTFKIHRKELMFMACRSRAF